MANEACEVRGKYCNKHPNCVSIRFTYYMNKVVVFKYNLVL